MGLQFFHKSLRLRSFPISPSISETPSRDFQDKEPKGIIPLENVHLRGVSDRVKPNCFELYSTSAEYVKACKMDAFGKVIEGQRNGR